MYGRAVEVGLGATNILQTIKYSIIHNIKCIPYLRTWLNATPLILATVDVKINFTLEQMLQLFFKLISPHVADSMSAKRKRNYTVVTGS